MSNITVEQIENIIIDAGVMYLNYGETDERILAPCRGDNTFAVEAEIREIEANGLKGKTKGMRRKISENAHLALNLMDLSLENLKMALPGSTLDVEGNKLSNGWKIEETDYLKNVTLIGQNMKGEYKKITIYNALADEGLEVGFVEDDESVIELQLSAHYDPTDTTDNLWEVEDLTSLV